MSEPSIMTNTLIHNTIINLEAHSKSRGFLLMAIYKKSFLNLHNSIPIQTKKITSAESTNRILSSLQNLAIRKTGRRTMIFSQIDYTVKPILPFLRFTV